MIQGKGKKSAADSDTKITCLHTKKVSQGDIKKTGCAKYTLQDKTKPEQLSHLLILPQDHGILVLLDSLLYVFCSIRKR